jgi:hypothetical protein
LNLEGECIKSILSGKGVGGQVTSLIPKVQEIVLHFYYLREYQIAV